MVYHSLGFYPRFFSDVCGAHLSLLSVFCILLSPLIVFVQCLPGLWILHSWLVFGFCWRLLFKSNMNHESVNGRYMSCLFHEKIMECNLFPYWNMINIQVRLLKNKHISTILWRGSCWCCNSFWWFCTSWRSFFFYRHVYLSTGTPSAGKILWVILMPWMYPSKYLPSLSYVKVNGNTLLNI